MTTPDFIVEVEVTVRTGFGHTQTIFRGLNSKACQIFDSILKNPGQAEIAMALNAKGLGNQDWNSEGIRTELKFQNSSMLRTCALTPIGTTSRLRNIPIPGFDPFLNQPISKLFSRTSDALSDWRKAQKHISKFVPVDQLDEALLALTSPTYEDARTCKDIDVKIVANPRAADGHGNSETTANGKFSDITVCAISANPVSSKSEGTIQQPSGAIAKPGRRNVSGPEVSAAPSGCKKTSGVNIKLISSDVTQLLKSYFHEKKSMDQIAEQYGRSKGTVCKYVNIAKAVMATEVTDILSDATISKMCGDISNFVLPDFGEIHTAIARGATRDTRWKEYVQANPEGRTYSRSTFFAKYADWIAANARRGNDDPDSTGLIDTKSD
jgi:hypothetical protein